MKNKKSFNVQALCLLMIVTTTVTISVYQKTGWNIMTVAAPIITLLPFAQRRGLRKQISDEEQNKEICDTLKVCHPDVTNTQAETSSCLDRYEERQAELLQREAERRKEVIRAINEYVTDITAGFLSKKSLTTLLSNISLLACGETGAYQPLSSDMERKLKSPDLRHLAWNIGERLGVSRAERARFILACIPNELRNATQMYIEANLRDTVPSHIRIDVPDKDDFRFHYRDSDKH